MLVIMLLFVLESADIDVNVSLRLANHMLKVPTSIED
jgi:hypothetical protein